MKILLLAGAHAASIKTALIESRFFDEIHCHAAIKDALSLLDNAVDPFDVVLLMDDAIDHATGLMNFLKALSALSDNIPHPFHLKFVTKDAEYEKLFLKRCSHQSLYCVNYMDRPKISLSQIVDICTDLKASPIQTNTLPPDEKRGWSQLIKAHHFAKSDTPQKLTAKTTIDSGFYSSATRRVIAITGDRGSGITSTVANLAMISSNQGLSTVIVDLDITRRGTNLYFSKFGEEAELRPELGHALVRCLAKPDASEMNACRINDKLMLISLAYAVEQNTKLLDSITIKRLTGLLAGLRLKYNIILLDLPFEFFRRYEALLLQIDAIGLCVSNNLYSIINTSVAATAAFSAEDRMLFRMKSKLVLSKHNAAAKHQGRSLSSDLTLDILNSLNPEVALLSGLAGSIPFIASFDSQIDTGKKICTTEAAYKACYSALFNALAQG